MDPCPFVQLTIGNLALKISMASKSARSMVHPSSSSCFCKIKLNNLSLQTALVPYSLPENTQFSKGSSQTLVASFYLSQSDLDRLTGKSSLFATSKKLELKISIYNGCRGTTCGVNSGQLLGKISMPLDLTGTESRVVFHNGWINVEKVKNSSSAQFHLNVKSDPDPKFVF
ncbi:hypothetical protein Fot_11328 [Forsythia ovata]|uniref:Uncharacterized protein n=1 Tax=Forsythia ovata TaxID=205694 RepID=A0ABD1WM99_9LAMI